MEHAQRPPQRLCAAHLINRPHIGAVQGPAARFEREPSHALLLELPQHPLDAQRPRSLLLPRIDGRAHHDHVVRIERRDARDHPLLLKVLKVTPMQLRAAGVQFPHPLTQLVAPIVFSDNHAQQVVSDPADFAQTLIAPR